MNYKALLILIATLSSCSSQPPALEADIPLVDQSFLSSHRYIPDELSAQLDGFPASVNIGGKNMLVDRQYHSASGKLCIQLENNKDNEAEMNVVLVCKNRQAKRWHYANDLSKPQNIGR